MLVLALALDDERAIGNFGFDILGLQTGQFRTDLELTVALVHFDCGHPSSRIGGSLTEKVPKGPIHFLTETAHQNEGAAGEQIRRRY